MILVDEALWSWRGRRWAHLVSDRSLPELHEFAYHLGKRRVGFQGDHYDVDEDERTRALALGAIAVDSRTLVRRLRSSGLRHRDRIEPWTVHHDGPSGGQASTIASASLREPRLRTRLVQALDDLSFTNQPLVLLERSAEAAAIVDFAEHHLGRLEKASSALSEVWIHPLPSPRSKQGHAHGVAELIARLADAAGPAVIRRPSSGR